MFDGDGAIYQNAYVVDDLDVAIDHWTTNVGAGPFFVKRRLDDLIIDYRGKRSSLDIDLALGQAGAVQIELIKVHSTNPTVYTDMYPKGSGGGFHHVGMFAKDFEAAIRAYEKKGFPTGMKGIFGNTPFAYMDARSEMGFFLEFHQDTDEIRGVYKRVADAAIGWDRKEKTRPL